MSTFFIKIIDIAFFVGIILIMKERKMLLYVKPDKISMVEICGDRVEAIIDGVFLCWTTSGSAKDFAEYEEAKNYFCELLKRTKGYV